MSPFRQARRELTYNSLVSEVLHQLRTFKSTPRVRGTVACDKGHVGCGWDISPIPIVLKIVGRAVLNICIVSQCYRFIIAFPDTMW